MQAHHSGESGDHETPCPRKRAARRKVHPTRPAAAAKTEQEVERGPLRDVVVHERAPSLELLAREEKTRRVTRDAVHALELHHHVLVRVRG